MPRSKAEPQRDCHQSVTYPCFFDLFRDICFILLKWKGEEKQKDHSHRPLWKQGQFLPITPLGISNMGNENWKWCHYCHFQQLSQLVKRYFFKKQDFISLCQTLSVCGLGMQLIGEDFVCLVSPRPRVQSPAPVKTKHYWFSPKTGQCIFAKSRFETRDDYC